MRHLTAIVFLLSAAAAHAISGTVAQIAVQIATDAELAEAVIGRGVLVQRASDAKDLRIGDGYTVGGISIWNFNALTSPPTTFPHDVLFDHHHVRLDGSYSLNAESGRMTAWYGTNAVWQIIAASGAAEEVLLSVQPEGTNMAFTVASESDDVTVEVCFSLIDPVWTAVEFGFERLTPLTIKITVPNPPIGEMQYIRVLTETGDVGMALSIPLSVPSLTVGGASVTAEAISNWNAAAAFDGSGFLPLSAGLSNAITGELWVSNKVISGFMNTAGGPWAALGGGMQNVSGGERTTVSGGFSNMASGAYSAIPGGVLNVATGNNSFAAGTRAAAAHSGSFVWSDTSGGATSTAPDQVTFRSAGGFRILGGRLEPFGGVRNPVNTTNVYLRPDGGTNTISFDADGNMIVAVDGTAAMTISSNGKVGIGLSPDSAFAVNVHSLKSSSSIQGSRFQDSASITYMVDPYGDSKLMNLLIEGTLKASGLPTATNGLVSGTLWNDSGTVKVMP